MEEFVLAVCEKDIKKLLKIGYDFIEYLKLNTVLIDYQQLPFLLDGLIPWLSNSNFKINLNGLEILKLLAHQNKKLFGQHVNTIVPAVVDKLGDQKDQVREAAQNLINVLMDDIAPPQIVFEKLLPAFTHKQWHAREQILIAFQNVLHNHGSSSITTSKYVPSICKLLSDQNSQVREQAHNTLLLIYTHIGERFKLDLKRKNIVPASKFNNLIEKFEEIRTSGKLLAKEEANFDPYCGENKIIASSSTTQNSMKSCDDQIDNASSSSYRSIHLAKGDTNINEGNYLDNASPISHYAYSNGAKSLYNEAAGENFSNPPSSSTTSKELYNGEYTSPDVFSSRETKPPYSMAPGLGRKDSKKINGPPNAQLRSASVTRLKKTIASHHMASTGRLNVAGASSGSHTNPSSSGAMDEESFYENFENVPKIIISSAAELDDVMTKIREFLSTDKTEWNKRNEEMRRIRSVVLCGVSKDFPESFHTNIRLLEPAFQLAIKDLRSQVVREACVTLGFLTQTLGIRLEHTVEYLLPSLTPLMSNSVKIMSSSAIVAIKFIIKHVHSAKLIPILIQSLSSKSREIRRNIYDFLDYIVHNWDTVVLERYGTLLQDAIKRGLQDADSDARASSRKVYWGFADHFRELADELIHSLDAGKQRMLRGEISNSSSNNSLATGVTSLTLGPAAGRNLAHRFAKTPNRIAGKPNHIPLAALSVNTVGMRNRLQATTGKTPFKRQYNGAISLEDIARHGRPSPAAISLKGSVANCGGSTTGLTKIGGGGGARKVTPNGSTYFFVIDGGDPETVTNNNGLLQNPSYPIDKLLSSNNTNYSGGSEAATASTLTGDSTLTSLNTNYPSYKNDSRSQYGGRIEYSVPAAKMFDNLGKRSTSAIDALAVARARKRAVFNPGLPSNGAAVRAKIDTNVHGCYQNNTSRRVVSKTLSTYGGSNTHLNQPAGSSYNSYRYGGHDNTHRVGKTSSSISQPGSRSTSPSFNLRNKLSLYTSIHQSYRVPSSSGAPSYSSNNSPAPPSTFKSHTVGRNNQMYRQYVKAAASVANSGKGSVKLQKNTPNTRTLFNKFPNGSPGRDIDTSSHASANPQKSDEEDLVSEHSSSFCSDNSFQHYAARYTASNYGTALANNRQHANSGFNGPPGSNPFYNTLGTDFESHEIIGLLASSNWADRKEGLIHILRFFRSGRQLKVKEIKPVMENFSKMFMDPHSKVFSIFLDALIEFVSIYHESLQDWLYVLLTKLLTKMGQELLTSIQTKCQKLLELIRTSFAPAMQFDYLCKFLTDQTMTPNFKVKQTILWHMLSLIPQLKSSDFGSSTSSSVDPDEVPGDDIVNDDSQAQFTSHQVRAMSKLITLTAEPKSVEVRKLAIQILVALFNLNPATFTMNLRSVTKHQQVVATEILKYHHIDQSSHLTNGGSGGGNNIMIDTNASLNESDGGTPTKRRIQAVGLDEHFFPSALSCNADDLSSLNDTNTNTPLHRKMMAYSAPLPNKQTAKAANCENDSLLYSHIDSAMNRLHIGDSVTTPGSSAPGRYAYTPHNSKLGRPTISCTTNSPNLISFSPAPSFSTILTNGLTTPTTYQRSLGPKPDLPPKPRISFIASSPNYNSNNNLSNSHSRNSTQEIEVTSPQHAPLHTSQSSPLGSKNTGYYQHHHEFSTPSPVTNGLGSGGSSMSRIPLLLNSSSVAKSSSSATKRTNSFTAIDSTTPYTPPSSAPDLQSLNGNKSHFTNNPVILVVNGSGRKPFNQYNQQKLQKSLQNPQVPNFENEDRHHLYYGNNGHDYNHSAATATPLSYSQPDTQASVGKIRNREPFDMTCLSQNVEQMLNGDESVEQILTNKISAATSNNSDRSDVIQFLAYLKYLAVNPNEFTSIPQTLWDKQFNQIIFPFLLKQLNLEDNQIKCNTLSTLREMVKVNSQQFFPYMELTLTKLVNNMKDPSKEVSRLAEECAYVFVKNVQNPSHAARIVDPLITNSPYPTNLHGIKILNQIIDHFKAEDLNAVIVDSVNALIKCCEHEETMVRKSAIYCLVSVHSKFGDSILPLFDSLSTQKRKILQLYIDRGVATNQRPKFSVES